MKPPAISVLLPAFNAAAFIRPAIESILAQSCGDFELLVIDDGSTDSTREVVDSFRDARMRVLANERNLGLTATLNRGLGEARGEFIARQDADDLSQPERFAKQLAFLRANPEVALLGTAARQVDAAGRSQGTLDMPQSPLAVRWAMLFDNPFLHSAVMFRREPVVEEFGGYDGTFSISQDYELWSRIARRRPSANLPERLLTLRAHGGSLMRSRREQLDAETRRIQSTTLAAEFSDLTFSRREMDLLAQFRWKLEPSALAEFWNLFERLRAAFREGHSSADDDQSFRQAIAAQMGRVGYNLLPEHRRAAWDTFARAVRACPAHALRMPWARIAALTLLGDSARTLHENWRSPRNKRSNFYVHERHQKHERRPDRQPAAAVLFFLPFRVFRGPSRMKRRFRVLHVIDSLDLGGAQSVLMNLLEHGDRARFEFSAAAMHGRGVCWEPLRTLGVPVFSLSFHARFPSYVPALAWLCLTRKYDVVHTHLLAANVVAKPIAALCGVPVRINHDHCNDKLTDPRKWAPKADEITNRFSTHVIAVSESTRRFVVEEEGVPAERATTIHNGVDIEVFQPRPERRAEARARWNLPADAFVVAGIGRLTFQKNFALFLEVAAAVRARHPHAIFVIAGTGEDEADLRAQAQQLGLGDGVRFLGYVGDMAALYPALDMLLLTSRYEGLPITILEAMAAGVAIVSAKLDGVQEILRDGEDSALVPPGDAAAFAARVSELIAQPEVAARQVGAALAKVRAGYSAEAMTRAVEAIYLRYLEPGTAREPA